MTDKADKLWDDFTEKADDGYDENLWNAGIDACERIIELEQENARLKRALAEAQRQFKGLRDAELKQREGE